MLRLLTFNTGLAELRLFGAPLYADVPHVAARLARLAPALRALDADVVALQEALPARVRRFLAGELRGLYPHSAGLAERGRFYGAGLLTLSRYPMTAAASTTFACQTVEEGLFGPRGALGCTVTVPGFGPCRILNLHTTAGGALKRGRRRRGPGRRDAQIAEAVALADRASEALVLLAGDFNCDPSLAPEAHRLPLAAGFAEAAALAQTAGGLRPLVTWDPDNPLNRGAVRGAARRVDHVFLRAREGAGPRVAEVRTVLREACVPLPGGAVPLSDHYGLLVELAP